MLYVQTAHWHKQRGKGHKDKANISCNQQLAVKNVKWEKSRELKQILGFFILTYKTSIHTETNLYTFKR